jgi:peptide/nickel transport system substrate-binding protein
MAYQSGSRANEVFVLDRNNHYTGQKLALARILNRHMPEPSTQRLLLQKTHVDIACNLTPELIDQRSGCRF